MMIQSVWKNLTGLQKAAEHLWCDFKWATNKLTTKHQWLVHMRTVISYTSKLLQQRWKYNFVSVHELCFHLCCHSLEVPFSLLKKWYFCPYNECTSHWCLVMNWQISMGGPWPMKATIRSRSSVISLKVWLCETNWPQSVEQLCVSRAEYYIHTGRPSLCWSR